jgi:uncharacterized protein YprB with RNaseH-like and TPR domain
MSASTLSTRLRDLLHPTAQRPHGGGGRAARDQVRDLEPSDVNEASQRGYRYVPEDVGGSWSEAGPGRCVVVEREYPADLSYGRQTIECYANAFERYSSVWPILDPKAQANAAGRVLFLDVETTGLSGGAGTYAFLVGCGFFADGAFHTRQFFMAGYEAEHELLTAVRTLVAGTGAVVTYNGKTFDLPLLETRYLFHRLDSPFESIAHLDLLHPARRLWRVRRRRLEARGFTPASRLPPPALSWDDAADPESCALGALEYSVIGTGREDDVPGFEIPGRFFHYLRTGDAAVVAPVLEHNRLDLVSLAALTSVALESVAEGPDRAPTAEHALALGRVYERAGEIDRATECHLRAAGVVDAPWDRDEIDPWTRGESLRWLAVRWRRARRHADAVDAWQRILRLENCPAPFLREATYALTVHYEHRSKDLSAARRLAMDALRSGESRERPERVRYRLARLERKIERNVSLELSACSTPSPRPSPVSSSPWRPASGSRWSGPRTSS